MKFFLSYKKNKSYFVTVKIAILGFLREHEGRLALTGVISAREVFTVSFLTVPPPHQPPAHLRMQSAREFCEFL